MANQSPPLTVVGLGEALFDLFDGNHVLGGAPLNAAVHSQQLLGSHGGRGVVASRIGSDDLGRQAHQALTRFGCATEWLQEDPLHPTGTVQVRVDTSGQPTYNIVEPVAWDFLVCDQAWITLAAGCHAVCFGTLAQRSQQSQLAIAEFLQQAHAAIRLFDVNLRQQYYSDRIITESLALATIVKLNEHEYPIVCGHQTPEQFRRQYELEAVVVTQGDKGTTLYTGEGEFRSAAPVRYPSAPDADAVGAGDACAAAILSGLLLELPPDRIVHWADHAGAYVASQRGATPVLPPELTR